MHGTHTKQMHMTHVHCMHGLEFLHARHGKAFRKYILHTYTIRTELRLGQTHDIHRHSTNLRDDLVKALQVTRHQVDNVTG